MCGIAGIISPESNGRRIVERQLESLQHRGPDSWGLWQSDDKFCILGHRRLAIVDLSPTGHQPMHSFCGRYSITFNGEIYNFLEIKKSSSEKRYLSLEKAIPK